MLAKNKVEENLRKRLIMSVQNVDEDLIQAHKNQIKELK